MPGQERKSVPKREESGLPAFLDFSPPVAWCVLLALTLLAYGNSISGNFVFDDTVIIQDNEAIRGLDWEHLKGLFGGHYWNSVESQGGLYRPMVMLTYAVNYALGGEAPAGYHLVNILLHGLNSLLVYGLVSGLFRSRGFALLGACLFLLHPVRTEGVASIVGRAESLSAFFLLASWLLYLRGRRSVSGTVTAASTLLFFLATLTKESAYSFVALLPLTDLVVPRGTLRKTFAPGALVRRYWPYLTVLAVSLALRVAVLGGLAPLYINPDSNPVAQAHPWIRFLTATNVFARYLGLMIFPKDLSADYSYRQIPPVESLASASAWLPLLLLLSMVAGIGLAARRAPVLFFCGSQFFLSFVLVSNWIRPIGTLMAERLLYFPSLGYDLAVAWLLHRGWESLRWRSPAAIAAALLVAGYTLRTVDRNADWRDHFALFSSAAAVAPESGLVQANYATVLLYQKNDAQGAVTHARRAVEIQPNDPAAHFTLAEAWSRLGRLEQAAASYDAVVRLAPRTTGGTTALRNLIRIYEALGDAGRSLAALETLVRWRPSDLPGWLSLHRLYVRVGQRAEAVRALEKARSLDPSNSEVIQAIRQFGAPLEPGGAVR